MKRGYLTSIDMILLLSALPGEVPTYSRRAGFVVQVHDPHVHPLLYENGITLDVGSYNQLRVTQVGTMCIRRLLKMALNGVK